MAYKVNYKGFEVTCESPEELNILLDSSAEASRRKARTAERVAKREHRSIVKLVAEMNGGQRKLLDYLMSVGSASDEQLRELLELGTNKQLAGALTSVSKAAERAGISREKLIVSTMQRSPNGDRTYQYSIPEESVDEVRSGLGLKEVTK